LPSHAEQLQSAANCAFLDHRRIVYGRAYFHGAGLCKEAQEPLWDNGDKWHVSRLQMGMQRRHLKLEELFQYSDLYSAATHLPIICAWHQLVCSSMTQLAPVLYLCCAWSWHRCGMRRQQCFKQSLAEQATNPNTAQQHLHYTSCRKGASHARHSVCSFNLCATLLRSCV
jgi:hypothetical protein